MLREEVLRGWTIYKEKIANLKKQLSDQKQELNKEKGWWDKWVASHDNFVKSKKDPNNVAWYLAERMQIDRIFSSFGHNAKNKIEITISKPTAEEAFLRISEDKGWVSALKIIKYLAEYYKDK